MPRQPDTGRRNAMRGGGLTGQMILLGVIALLAMVSGGWAHIRRAPDAERASESGATRS
ncbi:hypothetical protein [Streptomyces sp. NPDC059863]|uniref:hypothetical protein n=1 Tax=unclassified Streptomyces TaxID=2593676 RepID=UPI00364E5503